MDIKLFDGAKDIKYKHNRTIKYIVLHYTAGVSNQGENVNLNVCKYWNNSSSKASADFVVDENDIYQYNPDIENYYTYHCGGSKYSYKGGARLYQKCTNVNSIGIEMCSYRDDGNVKASAEEDGWKIGYRTIYLTKLLVGYLKKKYNIDNKHIITHFDVTGKLCPRPFLEFDKENEIWKLKEDFYSTFVNTMNDFTIVTKIKTKVRLNVRNGAGVSYKSVCVIEPNTILDVYEHKDGWFRTNLGWVCADEKYYEHIETQFVDNFDFRLDVDVVRSALEAYYLNNRQEAYVLMKYDFENNEMHNEIVTNDIYKFEEYKKWRYASIDTESFGKYLTLIDDYGVSYFIKGFSGKIL